MKKFQPHQIMAWSDEQKFPQRRPIDGQRLMEKKCTESLIIRKLEIKTTVRCPTHTTETSTLQKEQE